MVRRHGVGIAGEQIGPARGDLRRSVDRQRPLRAVIFIGPPGAADRIRREAGARGGVEPGIERHHQPVAGNVTDEGMVEDDEVVLAEHVFEPTLTELIEAAAIPLDLDARMPGAIGRDARIERPPAAPVIPGEPAQRHRHSRLHPFARLCGRLAGTLAHLRTYANSFPKCRNFGL